MCYAETMKQNLCFAFYSFASCFFLPAASFQENVTIVTFPGVCIIPRFLRAFHIRGKKNYETEMSAFTFLRWYAVLFLLFLATHQAKSLGTEGDFDNRKDGSPTLAIESVNYFFVCLV